MKDKTVLKFKPFLLSIILLLIDQLTKTWVVRNIPVGTIYRSFFNDFLWIVHVRNTGVAFSLGVGASSLVRGLLFIVIPIGLMVLLSWSISSEKKIFTQGQKWLVAGIIGGGLGTITDRIFRFSSGVVDFISVKFYGILGMQRWPTFNISDSCVVVFSILLAFSLIFTKEIEIEEPKIKKTRKEKNEQKK